jgi:catechol-2,3-dioxygenase
MTTFEINFLDHVAIRVKDLQAATNWYERVIGLKKFQPAKWGEFPIFMLAKKTGVALFPAMQGDPILNASSKNVKIDHFAFNLTSKNFQKAKKRFEELSIPYEIQDHYYFHSIYLKDLDDHTVELTTIVVDEATFYQ